MNSIPVVGCGNEPTNAPRGGKREIRRKGDWIQTEAYVSDMSRPLKRHSELGKQFSVVEKALMRAICERFGLSGDEPASVKHADDVLLMTEKRDLMPGSPARWVETAEPLAERIVCWTPEWSRHQFMKRAADLGLFGETA